MFNAHGSVRLTLQKELGELLLSGTLRADDIDSLTTLLRNEFGIGAVVGTGGEIAFRK